MPGVPQIPEAQPQRLLDTPATAARATADAPAIAAECSRRLALRPDPKPRPRLRLRATTPITRPITTRPLSPARASSPAAPATALAQRGCVAAPVVAGCCWSGLAARARCRCPGRRTSADRSMGTPADRPWRRPFDTARRLWALTSFYRHLVAHELLAREPPAAVRQPKATPTARPPSLWTAKRRAFLVAADTRRTRPAPHRRRPPAAAPGPGRRQARRRRRRPMAMTAATGPSVTRKGRRRATVVLPTRDRPRSTPISPPEQTDTVWPGHRRDQRSLLATGGGRRLGQSAVWKLVRCLAHTAGPPSFGTRHSHIRCGTRNTLAVDAGSALRDVCRRREPRLMPRRRAHSRQRPVAPGPCSPTHHEVPGPAPTTPRPSF